MSLPMDSTDQQQQQLPANNFPSAMGYQFPSMSYAASGTSNSQHQQQISNANSQNNSNTLLNNMNSLKQQGWPTAPPLLNRLVKYLTVYQTTSKQYFKIFPEY